MTCCIGKARIYYQEPLYYRLNYSGSINGSVTATEPLTTTCKEEPPPQQKMRGVTYIRSTGEDKDYISDLYAPANAWIGDQIDTFYFRSHMTGYSHPEGDPLREFVTRGALHSGFGSGFGARVFPLGTILEGAFRFKVIGTETGTVYREIGGLEECPAVENLGCVMGEEKYRDVMLPDQVPGGIVESSCIEKRSDTFVNPDCFHLLVITKYKKDELNIKSLRPPKMFAVLYLCGLPGCPAEYRVECCPEGECDPPKCPPDTDCELDCGDFICCYKKGKVIRTIQKT